MERARGRCGADRGRRLGVCAQALAGPHAVTISPPARRSGWAPLHGLAGSSHLFGVLPTLAFASRADGRVVPRGLRRRRHVAMTGFAACVGPCAALAASPPGRAAAPLLYASSPPPCWSAGLAPGVTRRRRARCPASLAAAAVMLAGFALADVLGRALLAALGLQGASPISGVPVAIVLGLLLRNLLPLPAALGAGLKFCTTTVLRLGIVLVGIKLSVIEMARLGAAGVPVVLAAIATGLVFVTWFNRRLGLPPRLGTLIAAGTSICGVTAIVSTAPAIDADEREVAYAVANVVAFGLFGMLVYPYLAHALLPGSAADRPLPGHGGARHLAGGRRGAHLPPDLRRRRRAARGHGHQADPQPVPGRRHSAADLDAPPQRAGGRAGAGTDARCRGGRSCRPSCSASWRWRSCDRSATRCSAPAGAALGVWDAAGWAASRRSSATPSAPRWLLGTAMAAVGLNTSFAVFKGVGLKPFAVGLAGALVVGAVGFVMATLLGGLVTL